MFGSFDSFVMTVPAETPLFLPSLCKGDVTRDDAQRQFLAQHGVAMLEQCCNHSKRCRNNAATLCCPKNRRCESSRVHLKLFP